LSTSTAIALASLKPVPGHGYGLGGGSGQLLLLVNPAEAEAVQSWRAGEANANSQTARYDFIPSAVVPPYLTDQTIVGAKPPDNVAGVPVLGSYGKAWLLESNVIPAGYFAVAASGGPDSLDNVIARRTHPAPGWQGLRHIPGHWQNYPLVESFFQRGLGCGTRHRSAACVVQLKASGTYDVPEIVL
jgi:hypothetical protein